MLRVADFFCGAGGFSEGFRQAGFKIVFAVDKWRPAIETYRANQHVDAIQDDVIRVSQLPDEQFNQLVPDTEVIIGSPPCVAFSGSNRSGKGDKTLGMELLHAYLRIVARKKWKEGSILRYWILENVPNIRNYIEEEYTADSIGVSGAPRGKVLHTSQASAGIYNAKYYGVASSRKRFLCGEFPKPTPTYGEADVVPMRKILDALGDPGMSKEGLVQDPNYETLVLPVDRISDYKYQYIIPEFEWQKAQRLKRDKGYMGKMPFPEDRNRPARTVMATMSASSRESMILDCSDGIRYRLPTVREAASLMSFPIDYRFYASTLPGKYRLVGNAVPPKLSFAVAKAICAEEKLGGPEPYPAIVHDAAAQFVDMNGTAMPEKTEGYKRPDAKFRYHIPYLIIDAYRVTLLNTTRRDSEHAGEVHCNWTVQIDHGQGKGKAVIYKPDRVDLDKALRVRADDFVSNTVPLLCGPDEFQRRHCMPTSVRGQTMGPYELLGRVKSFIQDMLDSEAAHRKRINTHGALGEEAVPQPIALGYYVVSKLVRAIGGGMGNGR